MLVLHCHCRDCQYASGGDGSTAMIVSADAVAVQGTPTSPALFVIRAATLDDPSWVVPAAHIWTDSAPPWACIPEAILEFPKNFGAS
jgi:hypothetical protein